MVDQIFVHVGQESSILKTSSINSCRNVRLSAKHSGCFETYFSLPNVVILTTLGKLKLYVSKQPECLARLPNNVRPGLAAVKRQPSRAPATLRAANFLKHHGSQRVCRLITY